MTSSTPARPPRWCARSCPRRISPRSTPSPWAAPWSTRSSPKCRRTPGSIFPGTPGSRSSRRSGAATAETSIAWGQRMTQREDDLFGDESDRAAMDEFERMRELLHARISEFADEHDVPDGMLSALLLDLAVTARMMDYTLSVEKPS